MLGFSRAPFTTVRRRFMSCPYLTVKVSLGHYAPEVQVRSPLGGHPIFNDKDLQVVLDGFAFQPLRASSEATALPLGL